MRWTSDDIPNQAGRIALVTGANSGLGFETSKALLRKGARVIICCRTLEKGFVAKDHLLQINGGGDIDVIKMDLSDLDNVLIAAEEVKRNTDHLDLLINNAGIMSPPRTITKQGLEIQFAVNHLSHMLLTEKLLPLLTNGISSRVVTVTSGAQYMGRIAWDDLQGERNYDRWKSYSQSKLANVMFALELQNRLQKSKTNVASLLAHPGLARTNLQSTSLSLNGSMQDGLAYKLMTPMFQSARMGALPQLFAATSPIANGGEQYGPRFNFRGYPKLCPIAQPALDVFNLQRFWKVSKQIIDEKI